MTGQRLPYYLFHSANAVVSLTGLVYGWMRYFVTPDDPWAVAHHPAQPHIQHLHILAAPLLILVLGWFWVEHAKRHWTSGTREGRLSGVYAWLTILPMILSGYLIQVSVGEMWRNIWVVVHLVTSALWVVAMATHWVVHRTAKAETRP